MNKTNKRLENGQAYMHPKKYGSVHDNRQQRNKPAYSAVPQSDIDTITPA